VIPLTLMLAVLALQTSSPAPSGAPAAEARVWTGNQVVWSRMPRPDRGLLGRELPTGVRYIANLDCRITDRGRLNDCSVMSEQANDVNFGRAAILGAKDARIEMSPEGPKAGDRLRFAVTLTMTAP
jgi:hypothetical protein